MKKRNEVAELLEQDFLDLLSKYEVAIEENPELKSDLKSRVIVRCLRQAKAQTQNMRQANKGSRVVRRAGEIQKNKQTPMPQVDLNERKKRLNGSRVVSRAKNSPNTEEAKEEGEAIATWMEQNKGTFEDMRGKTAEQIKNKYSKSQLVILAKAANESGAFEGGYDLPNVTEDGTAEEIANGLYAYVEKLFLSF